MVTPAGVSESWRLPGSGAGPSPDRLFLGSEGVLGVITESWLRVQRRPEHRASAAVRFTAFGDAVAAVREIAQSGMVLPGCRLLGHGEARFSGAATGGHAVLVLGAESAHAPVDVAGPVEIARAHGGVVEDEGDAVGTWRSAFLRMPYLRDGLTRCGAIVETVETACTWNVAEALIHAVRTEMGAAVREVCGMDGVVNCRFTPRLPRRPGAVLHRARGRASRHAARRGGRDQGRGAGCAEQAPRDRDPPPCRRPRPPARYDRRGPDLFAASLRAVKATLDPHGILNPGVLV